jgi:two-component system NtrC family sensor kinase
MSLRSKIFLILAVVVALYAAIDYGVQRWIVFPQFIALEQEEAKKDTVRCVEALRREIHHLDLEAHDWAAWDDTYEFVQDRNNEYIEANLNLGSFKTANFNLIYIVNPKGGVTWGQIYDLETEETIQVDEFPKEALPGAHPLLAHETGQTSLADTTIAGILMTTRGPMLVASRPILTSNNKGPIRGTIIMGRFLGDDVVETLVEQTRVDFQLWPIQSDSIPPDDTDTLQHITEDAPFFIREGTHGHLSVYTTFADIQGTPALLFRADIPREITAKGATALWAAMISILAAAAAVLLVLGVSLKQTVVDPIRKLTGHVVHLGKTDDLSARLTMQRSDEIGTLAHEFDRMMEQLSEARKKLLEQSYYAGMSEMAIGALHNIRNALNPVTGHIEVLREDLKKLPLGQMQMAQREIIGGNPAPERREDLIRFLALSNESLTTLIGKINDKMAGIAIQSTQIEKILGEHEKFAYRKRLTEKIELGDVLKDSMDMMPMDLRNTVKIKTDASVTEMPRVKAHRISLQHIFVNLLTNAAESIQRTGAVPGEINIYAAVEHVNEAAMVRISIQDNGKGIPKDGLQRIFGQGFSTKQSGSSGLGLHWCANTLASMHGRLYAESEGIGQGAVMHVLIPLVH